MPSTSTVLAVCLLHLVSTFFGPVAHAHPAVVLLNENEHQRLIGDAQDSLADGYLPKVNKRSFDRLEVSPFGSFSKRLQGDDDDAFPLYRRKKSFDRLDSNPFGIFKKRSFDRVDNSFGFEYGMKKRSLGNDAQIEQLALAAPSFGKQRLSIAKFLQQADQMEPTAILFEE
ncbi:hypothetical protein M3Y99_01160300 [Aphelenchoides fujianensis]|nr:hypothetical protein M3Y99_01160300 [Aphelenchoides fujianensis]